MNQLLNKFNSWYRLSLILKCCCEKELKIKEIANILNEESKRNFSDIKTLNMTNNDNLLNEILNFLEEKKICEINREDIAHKYIIDFKKLRKLLNTSKIYTDLIEPQNKPGFYT